VEVAIGRANFIELVGRPSFEAGVDVKTIIEGWRLVLSNLSPLPFVVHFVLVFVLLFLSSLFCAVGRD
jgi:hypothetical protein